MILTKFNLKGSQRSRCWVDEFPEIQKLTRASVTQTKRLESTSPRIVEKRLIAVEWLVPMGGICLYGLLGAELWPAESGFSIEIASTRTPLEPFEDSIASKTSEEVRGGLLEEYESAVLEGMHRAAKQQQELPSAIVVCNLAACGKVGSNGLMFQALGKAVLSLLLAQVKVDEDQISRVLKLGVADK